MCEAQSFRQHKRKKQETKATFEYIYRFMLGAGRAMSPHGKPVHEEMMEGGWQKDKEESKVRHKPYSRLCACPAPWSSKRVKASSSAQACSWLFQPQLPKGSVFSTLSMRGGITLEAVHRGDEGDLAEPAHQWEVNQEGQPTAQDLQRGSLDHGKSPGPTGHYQTSAG